MFGYFKEIALINVQSHPFSIFKFNGKTIHRIRGEGTSNSTGKSVLRKALTALMTPSGKNKTQRRALIRRQNDNKFCRIIALSTTGVYFELFLHIEEKHCYYIMKTDDYEVKKYLSDDYSILLNIAGFHFLKSEGYSLNIYATKEALPFTHFRPRLNYLILDSASGLKDYEVIMSDITENISLIEQEISIAKNTMSSLEMHIESIGDLDINSEQIHEKTLERFINLYKPIEEATQPLKDYVDIETSLSELDCIPTEPVKGLVEGVNNALDIIKELDRVEAFNAELSDLSNAFSVKPVNEVMALVKQLNNINDLTSELILLQRQLPDLSSVVKAKEVEPHIKNLSSLSDIVTVVSKYISYENELLTEDTLKVPTQIKDVVKEISKLDGIISNVNSLIQDKEKSNSSDCISVEPCKMLIQMMKLFPLPETDSLLSDLDKLLAEYETQRKLKEEIEHIKTLLPRCDSCGQILSECEEEII